MMKIFALLFFLIPVLALAQTTRDVSGAVQDTTGATIPGAVVKLFSGTDSLQTATDGDGGFVFRNVATPEFRITVQSIGYMPINRRFINDAALTSIKLLAIKMKTSSTLLNTVTVEGKGAVTVKEDTVEYRVKDFAVREGAPVEDVIKKLPGVDVDKDGNVTAQGKSVTKVRVNGKDFFGGDVKTATQNLPADVIESIQVVDDYGDQANLTGVKTGEPDKILNIIVRKDKNKGYFGQGTVGGGNDQIPASKDGRYIGNVNANIFNNDQQISLIGNLNNTNANTFTFSGAGSGISNRGGGGGGNNGGGGGGRGNAIRNIGQSANSTTVPVNGLNNTKSIGLNYRDDYGKTVTVYGSYSFSDRITNTTNNDLQITNNNQGANRTASNGNQNNDNLNHRFNFNLEWRPDTVNFIKFSPTLSYNKNGTTELTNFDNTATQGPTIYTLNSLSNTISPTLSGNLLLNHKFARKGRNVSLNLSGNLNKNSQDQTLDYNYTIASGPRNPSQTVDINNRSSNFNADFSYLEPVGKKSFLELELEYNRNYTLNNRLTDTLTTNGQFVYSNLLSNNFNYTFTTNRAGLNYRYIADKFNYTVGLGVQPSVLEGQSITRNTSIRNTNFNYIPEVRFVYRFSRTQEFRFDYDGRSNQPTFNQLQPVADLSNALFPVEGNSNLNPEFNNNLRMRYNRFDFKSGNLLLANVSFTQTQDKIVTNNINLPQFPTGRDSIYPGNSTLTRYLNTNGFYTANAFFLYSKPFAQRKYTISYNGFLTYNNNIGFINDLKNVGRNWAYTNGLKFRINLVDIMDTELNGNYTVNRTNNSLASSTIINTNVNTLNLGLAGKQYFFKDWTLGYDYTKTINNGYSSTITQNPNILNAYLERRFLKKNMGTLRLSAFDLFKENVGITNVQNANQTTYSSTNRLSRYYLLTFTYRLQKFAGKNPMENQDGPGRDRTRFDRSGGRPAGGGPSSF